jgi:hypothetical protein
VEVRARDDAGRALAGARVTARYAVTPLAGVPPEAEAVEARSRVVADAEGTARVPVPATGRARVLVERDGRAPAAVDLGPSDGSAPVEVVLAAGLRIPVRVVGLDGMALAGARVIGRAVVGSQSVERESKTGSDGRASVGTFGPGPVEVYAHAPGRAWAVLTVEASAAMATAELRLAPGYGLRLVVEDPLGLPLEGVHAVATTEDDGPPDVVPPGAAAWRTDASGVLVATDLPDRPYRIRLSLPGRVDEVIRGVRPGHATYFATLAKAP